jgi:Domain of unknown function (DUF4430)
VLRPTLLALVAVLAAAVASPALAAVVHVRVEGKTQTLYGPTEPRASAANALEALEAASVAGELYYHVASASFGNYVDQIGRYPAAGQTGWVYKVNGASPPVAADQVSLKDGDHVLWYWAQFGVAGGPRTLELQRRPKGCYAVLARNDAGASSFAAGATIHVDGRRIRAGAGRACLGPHRGLVWATLAGAVRSNRLT